MDGLDVRLFLGCKITAELRALLRESRGWQQECIAPPQIRVLVEIRFRQEKFIGRYLQEACPLLGVLRVYEADVRAAISTYCPKMDPDRLVCSLFPQMFVS